MKKQETHLQLLADFLPERSFEMITPFFKKYPIHLTLTHERKSVLGDYRIPTRDQPQHRISINLNLNKYSFLITLLHELAHLITYEHFKDTVAPHGKEWKTQFRHILIPFMGKRFFPADVEAAVLAYLHNPSASTCTDSRLYKALYRYDERKPGYKLVDDIQMNGVFEIEDGRRFQKVEQLRTRSKCKDLKTGRLYFFQGIVEVKAVRI
jgi:hypothetical protein